MGVVHRSRPRRGHGDRMVLAQSTRIHREGGLMQPKAVLDLRDLPDHGFGTRSLTWWGTVGMFAIEAMTLALGAAAYLYLMMQEPHWPPVARAPDLSISTAVTVVFVLSVIPN